MCVCDVFRNHRSDCRRWRHPRHHRRHRLLRHRRPMQVAISFEVCKNLTSLNAFKSPLAKISEKQQQYTSRVGIHAKRNLQFRLPLKKKTNIKRCDADHPIPKRNHKQLQRSHTKTFMHKSIKTKTINCFNSMFISLKNLHVMRQTKKKTISPVIGFSTKTFFCETTC